MDGEAIASAATGAIAGGSLVMWFAKLMLTRLISQIDLLIDKVSKLQEGHATLTVKGINLYDRIGDLSKEVASLMVRIEKVDERTEGLSSSYGPRIAGLEAEMNLRRGRP